MTRMPFRAFSTSSMAFTLYTHFCKKRVSNPTTTPTEEMSTGYICEHHEWRKSREEAASTNAAHVASAKEPKRSAPKPD